MKNGFFELSTPEDLLRKLEYEYEGLLTNPTDTYRAFNFFVTATHIADWISDGDRGSTNAYRKAHPILMVCDHLACGGKHFHLRNKNHASVAKAERKAWVSSGWVEEGWVDDELVVAFSGEAALELGLDEETVPELANRVIEFWREKLPKTAT